MRSKQASKRAEMLELSRILKNAGNHHFAPSNTFNFELEKTPDMHLLMKKLKPGRPLNTKVSSTNGTFGAIFGSEITKKYGTTLAEETYRVNCSGDGGQSFGAFIPNGLMLSPCSDANDYFGKGLSDGKLVVYPSSESRFRAEQNIIIGNVALYGATSGKAYIRGTAGELRSMIADHVRETQSELGTRILDNFDQHLPKFKKIPPNDFARMMRSIAAFEEKGLSHEQAENEAFYQIKNGEGK